MAKQIAFTYDNKEYVLEFTRSSIRQMERNGFDSAKAEASPMTAAYALFSGAFIAHHRNIDSRKVDEIFDKIGDLSEWASDLLEMYKDTFEATEDPDKGEIVRAKNW